MRALGASQRVMDIIRSAELPISMPGLVEAGSSTRMSQNLEIAGGVKLGHRIAGRLVFKVSGWHNVKRGGEGIFSPSERTCVELLCFIYTNACTEKFEKFWLLLFCRGASQS